MTERAPDVASVQEISATIADDLLSGASEIAAWLYGDPKKRRKVYHLAETSNFPHFKMGSKLHARKSVLREWFHTQERRRCGLITPPNASL